ncbi:MAG: glycoside hydrolase family 3 N-terminal domain-containing protein [Sharpea porci]|uniref:glycoside hydrolase family 3 N-terminal domain-containing protein n=1 Tax=Sharpea porci TaxID=2652286 RepID=UPI00240A0CE7|nr:glycoside hydrolase family 3 N-terminal domain-containing protein [Sharpea porci]MDD6711101.1 glycoside hydrolase family 3 N-terminal domain-containing protein [Sharpea porci]
MKGKVTKIVTSMISFVVVFMMSGSLVCASNTRVDQLLSQMTLRQKITQMMMVDFRKWQQDGESEASDFTQMNAEVQKIVEDYDFGSVILFANNIKETKQSYHLSMALQAAATKNGGIPLLLSTDQEGGSVYRLGSGTALPGNMALGATNDSNNAQIAGEIIGSELSSLGINTDLAPVVDVNNNPANPVIGLRSYGDDPTQVGNMAAAEIKGLAQYNVIGCVKHFPGHGDVATDSHYGLPVVDKSKDVLLKNELMPYKVAINQGIEMIMSAHILYPQLDNSTVYSTKTGQQEKLPSTLSHKIITDLLKGELGFKGVVVTDAMNMKGISNTFDQVQAAKLAINAGDDLLCMPCELKSKADLQQLDAIIDGIEKAVQNSEIPETRINDGVRRVLTLKENKGILDFNLARYSLDHALATVGSEANRAKEREISAKAVTVIKNNNNVLPLHVQKDSKVLMLTPYENEEAQMLMGFNRAKSAGLIPDGAMVKSQYFMGHSDVDYVKENLDWADIVIINSEVYGLYDTAYKNWGSLSVKNITQYCKENHKTSIVMSVHLPYDVQLYPDADALLAVYGDAGSSVDPTEAIVGGVTSSKTAYGPNIIAGIEVVLGTYGASGKLPVNVLKYDASKDAYTNDIVYKRGYGLTYPARTIHKESLQSKVAQIEQLKPENYTNESFIALQKTLEDAKNVLNKISSQEDIDAALKALDESFNALVAVKKDVHPDNNQQEKSPATNKEEKKTISTTNKEEKKAPITKANTKEISNKSKHSVKTGDTTPILYFISVLFVSLCAIVILRLLKKQE